MVEAIDIIEKDTISEQDFKLLIQYIDSIEFGSVSIKIQNNKVVQIEKSEKIKIR
jgi:hypothetical protein